MKACAVLAALALMSQTVTARKTYQIKEEHKDKIPKVR